MNPLDIPISETALKRYFLKRKKKLVVWIIFFRAGQQSDILAASFILARALKTKYGHNTVTISQMQDEKLQNEMYDKELERSKEWAKAEMPHASFVETLYWTRYKCTIIDENAHFSLDSEPNVLILRWKGKNARKIASQTQIVKKLSDVFSSNVSDSTGTVQ